MTGQFHDRLNPILWRGNSLRPIVRLTLLRAALAFYRFLDVPRLKVADIVITGSNAAFNYSSHSDIDVHLLVDVANTSCPSLADNLFTTKKALWSATYDVSVHDLPVEFYVEDTAHPATATGMFSLLHDRWLKHPEKKAPQINDHAVDAKVRAYTAAIKALLAQPSIADIDRILRRFRAMRQSGLEHGGEFAVDNLAYKALRDRGELAKLYKKRIELRNEGLSLAQ